MASEWDFFGIGIFYFGLDWKIPKISKSRRSGSGFENPQKIPREKPRKPINLGDRDWNLKTSKNPEKIASAKSRNPGDRDWDLKTPKKSHGKTRKPQNLGDRDLFFRDIPGIFLLDGISRLKATSVLKGFCCFCRNIKNASGLNLSFLYSLNS